MMYVSSSRLVMMYCAMSMVDTVPLIYSAEFWVLVLVEGCIGGSFCLEGEWWFCRDCCLKDEAIAILLAGWRSIRGSVREDQGWFQVRFSTG